MAKTLELEVSRIGRRGDGIADLVDRSVYVPYALPGETVRAKVSGDRGRLLEVLAPAPNRVPAPCPHFGSCGGCAIQHMADFDYRAWKLDIVRTALSRRGLAADIPDLLDAHGAGRRRVSVHAQIHGGRVFRRVHAGSRPSGSAGQSLSGPYTRPGLSIQHNREHRGGPRSGEW